MIITLVSQEKNLGILTLTDCLRSKLGKANTVITGWNYLINDYKTILEKIEELKPNKNIIIKYVIPKIRFSNQEVVYPKELENISDVIFKVPTYKEELAPSPILVFYKGGEIPFTSNIRDFYLKTI